MIHRPFTRSLLSGLTQVICLAILTLSLSACSKPSTQMVGEWSVDAEALERELHEQQIAPPAGPIVHQWKTSMTSDWAFRFNSDSSLEIVMNGYQYRGRYQISKVIGTTVYLRVELREQPVSELDSLLGISQQNDNIKVQHFSLRLSQNSSILKIDDLPPLKLRRVNS